MYDVLLHSLAYF